MDKRLWQPIVAMGIVGGMIFLVGGCSWNRTSRGWSLRPKYALEYSSPRRITLANCSSEGYTSVCDAGEVSCAKDTCGETLSEDCAEKMIDNCDNSGFLRMLQRRGRLGVCASCKKLMRLGDSDSASGSGPGSGLPPTAGKIPVVAKFNPVPTQPVFASHVSTVEAGKLQAVPPHEPLAPIPGSSLPSELPEEPEVIPAPPAVLKNERSLDLKGQPSWVFSKSSEPKPDPVMDIYIPPTSGAAKTGKNSRGTHASQPSTRR